MAHGDSQQFYDVGVRIGNSAPFRSPENDHAGFENNQGTDGRNKRVDVGFVLQGSVDDPFDQHPDQAQRYHRYDEGGPKPKPIQSHQKETDVCPQHIKMAVCKIGDVQDAEYQGEPKGYDGVSAPQHNAVEYLLKK